MLSDNQRLKEIKKDEWEQGIRPDKSRIGRYRNEHYKDFKQLLNPRADGFVDLILTGQTASTLFIHKASQPREFLFGMNDRYNLIGRYGLDILGLNQETFERRQKEIYKLTLVYIIKKDYRIA